MATRIPLQRFLARVLKPAGPGGANWCFVRLPDAVSRMLPSRGMVAVEGGLAQAAFRAVAQPDGEGGHWLKLPRALCKSAGVAPGDTVSVELAPAATQPEARVPPDLRKALVAEPVALAAWRALTPAARRDWIQWLESARQAATRQRRVASSVDMLLSGKRRVCCFDRSGIYGGGISAPRAADEARAPRPRRG